MAKSKVTHRRPHKAKPQGMTYAEQLARERRREAMLEAAAKDTMIKV